MFRTVPMSIIRSFSLYTQQWYMLKQVCWQLASKIRMEHPDSAPDDGQMNCPKYVEFHSKNKFEKLVHLVGFIIRNLSRCTITWTSNTSGVMLCRCRLRPNRFKTGFDKNGSKYLSKRNRSTLLGPVSYHQWYKLWSNVMFETRVTLEN